MIQLDENTNGVDDDDDDDEQWLLRFEQQAKF